MNVYVRHGLQAAMALVVVLGLLFLTLSGPEPGPGVPQREFKISVVGTIVLISIICYCLWRSHRSGVICMPSRYRTVSFHRATEPYSYWFWFGFYLLLIPFILWVMVQHLHELG